MLISLLILFSTIIFTGMVQPAFAYQSDVSEVLSQIKQLERFGRNMNRNNAGECVRDMRRNQAIVEELEEQTQQWSMADKMYVASILPTLKGCVSCSQSAVGTSCRMTRQFIEEAEEYLEN
ncbi:hypothetical protein IQ227_16625 [Anabaena aphanizomenioides LEGE 00250]|uniref:Uncharacterized protein n=1 Tax=Sphaerospermopsis aphanizomenoides LEGE 00250 TaxID=2777972 RepID=A0ABR9VHA4_9CYAN|nr:hypothetical protein [Sphaerospermopsis aphanizomenoides LEGE 00250]